MTSGNKERREAFEAWADGQGWPRATAWRREAYVVWKAATEQMKPLVEAAKEADIAMTRIIAGVSTGAITSEHDETMAYTINYLTSWRNALRQALATIEQQHTKGTDDDQH